MKVNLDLWRHLVLIRQECAGVGKLELCIRLDICADEILKSNGKANATTPLNTWMLHGITFNLVAKRAITNADPYE